MILMDCQAFLFDLDGTLWDSENAFIETLGTVLKAVLKKPVQKETIASKLAVSSPIEVMKSFDVFSSAIFWKEYKRNYSLVNLYFDNTKTILEKLAKKGKRLGVVTSLKRSASLDLLDKFGLLNLMHVIITPSETSARKPSPIPISKALGLLRQTAKKAIYVGNTDFDIISAKKAGCIAGLAVWGSKMQTVLHPDFKFNRLEDILALCEEK